MSTSKPKPSDLDPFDSREQLVEHMRLGSKTEDERGLGVEHEKFGFRIVEGELRPLDYADGIVPLLEGFIEKFGWEPDTDDGAIIALHRGEDVISLEPGCQLELAGGVVQRIDEIEEQLFTHFSELAELDEENDLRWLTMGMRPIGHVDDVSWLPKRRYTIMRPYLPTRGARAHEMMKLTATIQVNLDYMDEEDAASMLECAQRISPIVSALNANSPFVNGSLTGLMSNRCAVWLETDPDRTGYLAKAFEPGFTFGDYVDYLLDIPMFFIQRDGAYIDATKLRFKDFMERGLLGHRPTRGDWETHMSTAFPEARLKRYLEVRGADCVPPAQMLATSALYKGLLYDLDVRKQALELMRELDTAQHLELHHTALKDALAGEDALGRPLLELGKELVRLARTGLDDEDGGYLDTFEEAIFAPGMSLAEQQVARYHATDGSPIQKVSAAIARMWVHESMESPAPAHASARLEDAHLDVLYQDEHLLAVNKPAGLAVHPGLDHEEENLVVWVRRFLAASDLEVEGLAPANRLDKEASGIVLFGLNPEAKTALGKLFAEHKVDKAYWIITSGRLRDKGVINRALKRGDETEKASKTKYKTIASTEKASFAKAWTESGRTHQVRRHMASIGHPIMGDLRYGYSKAAVTARKQLQFERILLHARQLTCTHPITGERLHLVASPGAEWDEVVARLGLKERKKKKKAA